MPCSASGSDRSMSSRYHELPPSMIVSPPARSGARLGDRTADERRRHHDPDVPGRVERSDEGLEAGGSGGAVLLRRGDRGRIDVVGDARVAGLQEPPHHVGAHPSETDHAELHATIVTHRAARHRADCRFAGVDDRSRALDDEIAGCAAAHQRLLGHIDQLDDADVRRPSLLPGWTVGHVLTHLARNADSFVRILEGAERGDILDQYEGGARSRAAAIEAGSSRSAGDLVHDVRATIWRLERTWAGTTPVAWGGSGRATGGELLPCIDLPFRRWREVEVHHVDLGLPGFTIDDWSSAYVRRELQRELMRWRSRKPMGFADLPPPALELSPNRRLAWLLGRHRVDVLPDPGPWR